MNVSPTQQGRPRSGDMRRNSVTRDDWGNEDSAGRSRCSFIFPLMMCSAAYHLARYISKLASDSQSFGRSWHDRDLHNLIITAFCLVSPTVIYAIYETLRAALSEENDPRHVLTKLIKGMLLIPWQIKGHCELLYFFADRACLWRRLYPDEKQELSRIHQETFVLEFFVDFYSGFIHELLQLYILLGSADHADYFQLGCSTLSVLAIIAAFQRADDAYLTKCFSYIGWVAYCASRVLSFVLLWSTLGGVSVLSAILAHALIATMFVFAIIKGVHDQRRKRNDHHAPYMPESPSNSALVILAFFLFGLPSIIYWPMLFAFKKKRFVSCFLILGIIENALCVGTWHLWKDPQAFDPTLSECFVLASVTLTAVAVLFIILYLCCKPELTDQVVLSHILEKNTNKYGVYFDFCKAVHVLPEVKEIDRRRRQLRTERPDLV